MDCEEAIVEGFFCVQCWILVLVRVSRLSRFRAKMRWCCSVPFSFLFGVRKRKFEIYKRERELSGGVKKVMRFLVWVFGALQSSCGWGLVCFFFFFFFNVKIQIRPFKFN